MGMNISAPHPASKVTIVLPSPKFSDSKGKEQSVSVKRTITGGTVTYVKSSDRYRLALRLELTKMKAIELQRFIRIYYRAELLLTMHDGTRWAGKLINNPFDNRSIGRAGGLPGGEMIEVTIEVSATQVVI